MALPTLAIPGQLLGPTTKYTPGPGTHVYNSSLYASIAGPPTSTPAPPASTTSSKPTSTPPILPTLSIPRLHTSTRNVLPTVDSVVLCRVTRTQTRQATVAILVVGDTVCADEFQGVIRKEDVRATEKDKVVLGASFVPGDVVRACVVRSLSDVAVSRVAKVGRRGGRGAMCIAAELRCRDEQISLGDQSNYYLSTARNELGVVMATSEAGNAMYPVSWKEFRDPVSGETELRKVAKPF